jgi:uncharacterized protein YukE
MSTEYERVMAEVKRLESVADELQSSILTKLNTLRDQQLVNWHGESSIKFINELDEMVSQLKKEAKSIDTNASALKRVAKLRKETSEKAARLVSGTGGPFSGGGGFGGSGGGGSIDGGGF